MSIFRHREFKNHERVIYFADEDAGLKGIIAIHNRALGNSALGGTRMYPYAKEQDALRDVLRLSRGMTYKSAVAGLRLGGAKAVIIGNPRTQKTDRLLRAIARVIYNLRGDFVTGEDIGMSVKDVDCIGEEIKMLAQKTSFEDFPFVVGRSSITGEDGDPSRYTAEGVFLGAQAALAHRFKNNGEILGKSFSVQGICGNVGSRLAELYLKAGGVVFGSETKENIPAAKEKFAPWKDQVMIVPEPDMIYSTPVDVFSPCAMGGILTIDTVGRLACSIVAGSANNQLATSKDGERLLRKNILYVPDYVINAGGLFAVSEEYFAQRTNRPYRKENIERNVERIGVTIQEILERAEKESCPPSTIADKIAEERIENPRNYKNEN